MLPKALGASGEPSSGSERKMHGDSLRTLLGSASVFAAEDHHSSSGWISQKTLDVMGI